MSVVGVILPFLVRFENRAVIHVRERPGMPPVLGEKELHRFLHGFGVEVLEGCFFDFEGTPVRPPHLAYLLVLIDGEWPE